MTDPKNSELSTNAAPLHLLAVVFVVNALALLKGAALAPHPYALSQYLYDYQGGFLIRGLPGHVAFLLFGENFQNIEIYVNVIGTASMVLLFTTLHFLLLRLAVQSRTNLSIFVLALSGPVLITLGSTRGYHDALFVSLGLLGFYFVEKQGYGWTLLFVLPSILIHEMTAAVFLPLLAFSSYMESRDRRARVALALVLSAFTFAVVAVGQADDEQTNILVSKLERSEEVFADDWPVYLTYGPHAAQNSALETLEPDRLLELVRATKLRVHLVVVSFLVLLGVTVLVRKGRIGELAAFSVCALSPLAVALWAWDLDRVLSLAAIVVLFLVLRVTRKYPVELPFLAPAAVVLVPVFLFYFDYEAIHNYAGGATVLGELGRLLGGLLRS